MAYNAQNANLLQYKLHPFIGGPKVSSLQHCGPVPTVTQTLTSDSRRICTWGSRFLSHHCSLQSSMLPNADHGYYAPLPFFCPSSSIPCPRRSFSFMRVAEPSCLRHCLQCSGWSLSSQPLRYCRLPWLLCPNSHGFWLWYVARNMLRRRSFTLSLHLHQNCLSAKMAASSVAAGPCSNTR